MYKDLKLQPPDDLPPKLSELMTQCFQSKPQDRPTFQHVLEVLNQSEEQVRANPFYM